MRSTEAPATCLICGKLLPAGSSYSRRYCDECGRERNRELTLLRAKSMSERAAEAAAEKQSAKDRAWCRRCIYANTHDHVHLCNYILITHKMRGCHYGVGCERRTVP